MKEKFQCLDCRTNYEKEFRPGFNNCPKCDSDNVRFRVEEWGKNEIDIEDSQNPIHLD